VILMVLDHDGLALLLTNLSSKCVEQKEEINTLNGDLDIKKAALSSLTAAHIDLKEKYATLDSNLKYIATRLGYDGDVHSDDFQTYVSSYCMEQNRLKTELEATQHNLDIRKKWFRKIQERYFSLVGYTQNLEKMLRRKSASNRILSTSLRDFSTQLYLELRGKEEDKAATVDEVIDIPAEELEEIEEGIIPKKKISPFKLVVASCVALGVAAVYGLMEYVVVLPPKGGVYDNLMCYPKTFSPSNFGSIEQKCFLVPDYVSNLPDKRSRKNNPVVMVDTLKFDFFKNLVKDISLSVPSLPLENTPTAALVLPETPITKVEEVAKIDNVIDGGGRKLPISTSSCGFVHVKEGFTIPNNWENYVCRVPVATERSYCYTSDKYSPTGTILDINGLTKGCPGSTQTLCCPPEEYVRESCGFDIVKKGFTKPDNWENYVCRMPVGAEEGYTQREYTTIDIIKQNTLKEGCSSGKICLPPLTGGKK